MEETRIPQLLIRKTSTYQNSGAYLIGDVDPYQRERHNFVGDNGETNSIFLSTDHMVDQRRKHPNIGVIYGCGGDTCFNVGDRVIVEHSAFREGMNPFKVFHTDPQGNDYYRVINKDILCALRGDQVVPRKFNLICKQVYDKVIDTTLELPDSAYEFRRDVVIVEYVWEGCTEYKKGDILLIEKNSDYPVEINGEPFVKVDTNMGIEVLAVLDNLNIRKKEVHRHARHN